MSITAMRKKLKKKLKMKATNAGVFVKDNSIRGLAVAGLKNALNSKDPVISMDDDTSPVVGWIPTGIWPIDYGISDFRGIPLGKSMIVWGPESSGKTSFLDYVLWLFQQRDGLGVRFDYDDALDPTLLKRRGTNLKKLIVPNVTSLEDGVDAMNGVVTGVYGSRRRKDRKAEDKKPKCELPMIVQWDSINSACPEALLDRETAKKNLTAVEARAYSLFFKVARLLIRSRPIAFILTGEIRDKIGGSMPGFMGPQHNLAGGKAMKHYPTTILKFTSTKIDKKRKSNGSMHVKGMWVYGNVDKARFGRKGRKFMFYISYSRTPGEGGPHAAISNLQFLKDNGMLKSSGKDGFKIKGLDIDEVITNASWPEFMKEHEDDILALLKEELLTEKIVEVGDDEEEDLDA